MKHFFSQLIPQSIKNALYHFPLAVLANLFFGFPGKRLRVIGVTGTNGKTTTTQMLTRIFEEAGHTVAMASTINFQIGKKRWTNASKFTTTSAWQLQRFLSDARKAGCNTVILETSSHALDQGRVWGIPYAGAVITNVTREHLDYHETMEKYAEAKLELFKKTKRAAVSLDTMNVEPFLRLPYEKLITYSIKNIAADLHAEKIELEFATTKFLVGETEIALHLPGYFNIENALAAMATAKLFDIPDETIARALGGMTGVPGRMELVPNNRGVDIIIDYAVTPDSLEKLYESVLPQKIPGSKIIHIFGACGERDRGKRPEMARIVSEKADVAFLTTEDPYYEPQSQIFADLEKGMTRKKDRDYFIVEDRREAIHRALTLAERGDIVLVTGKGAEETMALGDKRVSWKERQVIEEELAKLS